MRTLIDLPEDDMKWLDQAARAQGISRAAIVRDAVAMFRHREDQAGMEKYFGLWERNGSKVDGLDYERGLRDEWPSAETLGAPADGRDAA